MPPTTVPARVPPKRYVVAGFLLVVAVFAIALGLRTREAGSDEPVSKQVSQPAEMHHDGPSEADLVAKGLRELRETHGTHAEPFAILDTNPEPIPLSARRMVKEVMGPAPEIKLRFRSAQYARAVSGPGVWILQGRGVTCLFEETGVSSCATTLTTYRRGLTVGRVVKTAQGIGNSRSYRIVGLTPNDVAAVAIRVGNEFRTLIPTDHLFSVYARRPIHIEHFIWKMQR